jgi:hypothetical protein
MALINNRAKEIANEDKGLEVNTEMYLQNCIAISAKKWKESKVDVDAMDDMELGKFILATQDLNLNKVGAITVRVNIREYAQLKAKAKKDLTTVTGLIERVVNT